MSDKTLFGEDGSNIIPSKNIKYLCNVALQIQSVFHSTKDKDKDVVYYLQVLLEQCCYELFVDTRKIDPLPKHKKLDPRLKRTYKPKPESESESESESEEEINEDTVIDE